MLEFWKRKEKRIALEWGMSGFETGTNQLRSPVVRALVESAARQRCNSGTMIRMPKLLLSPSPPPLRARCFHIPPGVTMTTKNAFCIIKGCDTTGLLSFSARAMSLMSTRLSIYPPPRSLPNPGPSCRGLVAQVFPPILATPTPEPLSPSVPTGEQARPEYKGEFIPSPINGKTIL